MRAYVVKPVPVPVQAQLRVYLGHNNYRFVFYTYGTTRVHSPHYGLYIWDRVPLLAELYISEYIVTAID
jgi:hypothetical protein